MDKQQLRLYGYLRDRKYPEALCLLMNWLPTASYKEVSTWIAEAPGFYRPRVATAIRDVLTGYPEIRYGTPVLIRYEPAPGIEDALELPLPDTTPDDVVTGIQWLPLSVLRDGKPLLDPRPEPVIVMPYTTTCAVLAMRTKHPYTIPAPSADWWSEAFRVPEGNRVRLSGTMTLPWIDAIEAGCMLQARAMTANPPDTPRHFLDDTAFAWALDAGAQFRMALQSL